MITAQTSFGHIIPIYNMELTIYDPFRNRMAMQMFQEMLKGYDRRKDKDLQGLMQHFRGTFAIKSGDIYKMEGFF